MIDAEIAEQGSVQTFPISTPRRRPARLGALVAAAICGVIAIGGWIVQSDGGMTFGLFGLPAATVLGYRLAGRVVAADRRGAAVVGGGLAIGTILVTDALVIIAMVVESMADSVDRLAGSDVVAFGTRLATDFVTAIPSALFFYLVGAVIVGVPALLLTVPAAMVWAILVASSRATGWPADDRPMTIWIVDVFLVGASVSSGERP